MKHLILCFFLLFPAFVNAATTPSIPFYANNTYSSVDLTIPDRFFTSPQALCTFLGSRLNAALVLNSAVVTNNICKISYTNPASGGQGSNDNPVYTIYGCPAGTIKPSGTITAASVCTIPTCPAGQIWNLSTGSCAADCLPKKGKTSEFTANGSAVPSSVCMGDTCAATVSNSLTSCVSNQCFGSATATYTGNSCAGQTPVASITNPTNTNPPVDKPETDCVKQGQSFGTVNGAVVCVGIATPGAAPITKTSNSSTTTKSTDAQGNETTTGSTVKDSVSQDGSAVTTTQTKTNDDGSKEETSNTLPFDAFCEKNPTSSICKEKEEKESKFTGSCLASFSCEGDAVQCAMALKQHTTYCENTQANTYSDIFNNSKSAADGLTANGGSVLPGMTVNIPSTIQGQKLLTSGGLSDITFPVGGQSIVLPLSKLNSALEFAGQMVLIISYLISAYILFGHKGAQ